MRELQAGLDASGALAAAARIGPYFVLDYVVDTAGWRPLSLLMSDPVVLAERVASARKVIADRAAMAPADVAERVAASVMFLGLAARLVSPSLGAAVVGGVVPCLAVDDLWWRPVAGGPWPLAATTNTGRAVGGLVTGSQLDDAAAVLSQRCVQDVIGPLISAFHAEFRLSEQVLWGNVASALAGAAGMLAGSVPRRAEAAGQLTQRILALGRLRGTGDFVQPDASDPRRFLVRRSCCLLYRVPAAETCGDCVLTPEDVRRRQQQFIIGAD